MTEPYDVTNASDRARGFRRFCDRTGREWIELRVNLKSDDESHDCRMLESPRTPAGFREVTLKAWTDGRHVVVPEQEGFRVPCETKEGTHDCDANGCGWEHVLCRFDLPEEESGG